MDEPSETTKKPGRVDLRQLLLLKQEQLDLDLKTGRVAFDHPGEKGAASESAWVERLNGFLPRRYRVSSAFVIDADGNRSAQLDVVIYDRHFCPLLFEQDGKFYVPAESVFAVFEVKQTLDRGNLEYASEKIASVRALRRTSTEIVDRGEPREPRRPFHIIGGLLAYESGWKNPPLGDSLRKVLLELRDKEMRIDLGCAVAHGSFEAVYSEDDETLLLDISQPEGALMYFEMTLFRRLQGIGSPMAIDMKEYLRVIEAQRETPPELQVDTASELG